MNRWRLVQSEPMSGAWNMAIDEMLLEEVAAGRSLPVLRLYRWDPAAVSLGYGQKGPEQVNLEACRRRGFDVVRRITGGRAVLHDREVTYAVVARDGSSIFPGDVLGNYRIIASAILKLYAELGIEGALVSGKQRSPATRETSSVCFTIPSSYEVIYQGRKLTGGAQKRQNGAFLQHGSLPLDIDLEGLWEVLSTPDKGGLSGSGTRFLEQTVGWINRWQEKPATQDMVEKLLVSSFTSQLLLAFQRDGLQEHEWQRARELVDLKYGRDTWNLQGLQ